MLSSNNAVTHVKITFWLVAWSAPITASVFLKWRIRNEANEQSKFYAVTLNKNNHYIIQNEIRFHGLFRNNTKFLSKLVRKVALSLLLFHFVWRNQHEMPLRVLACVHDGIFFYFSFCIQPILGMVSIVLVVCYFLLFFFHSKSTEYRPLDLGASAKRRTNAYGS